MERISEEKFFSELQIPVQLYTEPVDFVEFFAPAEKPKETKTDYLGKNPEEKEEKPKGQKEKPNIESSETGPREIANPENQSNKYKTAAKMIVAAIDIAIPALVELIAEKQTENATQEEKEELKEQWFEYFQSIEKTPAPWVFLIITNLSVYGLDFITIGKGVYDRVKNNGQIPNPEKEVKTKEKAKTETKQKPVNPFKVKNSGVKIDINEIEEATIEEETKSQDKTNAKTDFKTAYKNGAETGAIENSKKEGRKCAECSRPLLVGQKTYCSKKCSAIGNNRKRQKNAKS